MKKSRQEFCAALALALAVGGVVSLQAFCPPDGARELPVALALRDGGPPAEARAAVAGGRVAA